MHLSHSLINHVQTEKKIYAEERNEAHNQMKLKLLLSLRL